MGDKMDDLALALDGAVDRHHPGRKDYAALPFIEFWPDHEIGDASLVLDGDEDDAFAPPFKKRMEKTWIVGIHMGIVKLGESHRMATLVPRRQS